MKIFALINALPSNERLPRALEDEDYEILKGILKCGEIKMKKKYSATDKRIYRLFHSKKYIVEETYNPVLQNTEEAIVSKRLYY